MSDTRQVAGILRGKATMEGAGVRLKRIFGYNEAPRLDPFLLFDHFGSDTPDDFIAGFPWHPHRGIETVTYMLHGSVEHGDSIGNKGVIGSGDVQWMTAGSGIIHQEMPQRGDGSLDGFQLWVNLPASKKMTDPRYKEVLAADIPEAEVGNHVKVKVISGSIGGVTGPVTDIIVDTIYLDVSMAPMTQFDYPLGKHYAACAYVIEGAGYFDSKRAESIEREHLVIFQDGGAVHIITKSEPMRFLFIAGEPIGEPIAWRGPIVMNTDEELKQAFEEYRNGTFIKDRD
ncbi:MAG: pirin family protein [Candidatus Latescibacterota bacterium]